MSAEIDLSNGRANIAYFGDTPWHGLGVPMDADADLDKWRIAAGLDHNVIGAPAMYLDPDTGDALEVPSRQVLVRDDTKAVLSVVDEGYNIVQPRDVIDFYKTLIEAHGFSMETAGSLRGGQRIWALAKTGDDFRLKGQDQLLRYIMLATSYDGRMSTIATETSVRVVCMNTFRFAVGENGENADIRIPHHTVFSAEDVKKQLNIGNGEWIRYVEESEVLSDRKVNKKDVVQFFVDLFYDTEADDFNVEDNKVQRRLATMVDIFHNGVGQETVSARGTAWGLVNAVSRFTDHERKTRTVDNRMNSAWFGDGNRMKQKAHNMALKLVA